MDRKGWKEWFELQSTVQELVMNTIESDENLKSYEIIRNHTKKYSAGFIFTTTCPVNKPNWKLLLPGMMILSVNNDLVKGLSVGDIIYSVNDIKVDENNYLEIAKPLQQFTLTVDTSYRKIATLIFENHPDFVNHPDLPLQLKERKEIYL